MHSGGDNVLAPIAIAIEIADRHRDKMSWLGGDRMRNEAALPIVLQPEETRPARVVPVVKKSGDNNVQPAIAIKIGSHRAVGAVAPIKIVPFKSQVPLVFEPLHAVIRTRNQGRQVQVVAVGVK